MEHSFDLSPSHPPTMSLSQTDVLSDYRLGYRSRQASLTGRKEVLTGKAKFGIFGDGKEVAQLAMARATQPGDFRSGYYRDQTWALATGLVTLEQFFAQLYAHADVTAEPHSAGRQMNAHFASRSLNTDGTWRDLTQQYNSSADGSPTASQMPRLVGLAQASKLYRDIPALADLDQFSRNGNEIAFGTIGNASCAEGLFWEAINAIGVLQIPAVMSIWDDGYGISVPNHYQVTKSNISEVLKGFQRTDQDAGFEIFRVHGWDYPGLYKAYQEAAKLAREAHVPSIIHVIEMTQPQGHSTSGSHERYKSPERLAWEAENDCLLRMRQWIIREGMAGEEEMDAWEKEDRKSVRKIKNTAWDTYLAPIQQEQAELSNLLKEVQQQLSLEGVNEVLRKLTALSVPSRGELMEIAHEALVAMPQHHPVREVLLTWKKNQEAANADRYNTYLYSHSTEAAKEVEAVPAAYSESSPIMSGFEVLNKCFDLIFERDARAVAFGEDVGYLGDVNQGFKDLQAKYTESRIFDTGIREATIAGQAIGLALRGLRPIAEIQYLDYFIYAIQTLSDDLACLQYRTRGGQKAPAIIRTRGHRLEGIWHAGSPMGMIIHALRGMHVLVPRNMTQAAGFYNTLFKGDEPAVVVEVLNGYRLKEKCPDNLSEFCLPLGVPEILREGDDVTIVTYGACCRIAMAAAEQLSELGIEVEVIDVQSLLPFDRHHRIVESLKKTSRILFLDEDVPGGATAFMMQEVLEKQGGYYYLDSEPVTLTSQPHRPAYGSDGDYFSKPQVEHVFKEVYELMNEAEPDRFPELF
ncbi:MAG: thiamine pyrophosphate-dependent enzyme [Bacteroidota bacterium]